MATAKRKKVVGKPFEKGQSGNPSGRPKVIAHIRDLARQHTDVALKALVDIVTDTKATDAARVSAATQLLDRGYGRAPQTMEVKGLDGLLAALNTTQLGLVEQILAAVAGDGTDSAPGDQEAPRVH